MTIHHLMPAAKLRIENLKFNASALKLIAAGSLGGFFVGGLVSEGTSYMLYIPGFIFLISAWWSYQIGNHIGSFESFVESLSDSDMESEEAESRLKYYMKVSYFDLLWP